MNKRMGGSDRSRKWIVLGLACLCWLSATIGVSAAPGDLDFSFGVQGRRIKTVPNSQPAGGHDFFSADITLQPDGKILIAGFAFDGALGDSMVIARYNPNGTLDSGFANGGIFRYEHGGIYSTDKLYGVALQPDGKIVAVGRVDVGNGNPAFATIRLNPNGSFDSTFGTNGIVIKDFFSSIDEATEVAIQADGGILVSGWVTQGGVNDGTTYDFTLLRYNTNGSLDASFGNGGVVFTDFNGRGDLAQASVLQPDGRLVVAGWVATTAPVNYDFGMARYNTDGSLDATFGASGKVVTPIIGNLDELVRGIALAPGGKIVLAGELYNPPVPGSGSGHRDVVVVRYNQNGSLDTTFDSDGKFIYDSNLGDRSEGGEDVTVQPDGKILVAGKSHLRPHPGGADIDMLLLRIREEGGLDASFGNGGIVYTDFGIFAGPFTTPRSGDTGTAIVLQPDGKIVVAGDSYFAGDTTEVILGSFNNRLAVARFLNDITSNVVRTSLFDFDGDGSADVSVFRPSEATWYILQGNGGYASRRWGVSTDKIMPGDYDGDGKADLAVFRKGENSTWYILDSSTNTYRSVQWGASNLEQAILFDTPVPADYDGDRKTDLAMWRLTDHISEPARYLILQSSNGASRAQQWGSNSDRPVPADFDGDDKSDLAVYRGGNWWWRSSRDGEVRVVQFGLGGDTTVPADYDGDGTADYAVFRNGTWYLQQSQLGFAQFSWGISTDIPVPADYDGDGKTDVAIFRDGAWWLRRSQLGVQTVQFGLAGDVPIPAAILP